jgi:hypothetical protein
MLLNKDEIMDYISVCNKEDLYNIIMLNDEGVKLSKYNLYKDKFKKEIKDEVKTHLLRWSECKLDKNKEVSNKIYMRIMKNVLRGLHTQKQNETLDEYCDMSIFANEDTFDKVKLLIKDECHNMKCQIIKTIKIYIKHFTPKTNIVISNRIFYLYESYYDELNKSREITKETKDIINFEDLLIKLIDILNGKIELTKEQLFYNDVMKIICLIYSYGYNEIEESVKIGILRYNDLINTIVVNEDKDINKDLNYISYKDKKWYIRKEKTKNKADRVIDLTDDFLLKLGKLRENSKNNYLLMFKYKSTSSLISMVRIYDLPNLNDMRKSAEQYAHDNLTMVEGLRYTANIGHTVKTNMVSYINQKNN